MSLQKARSCTEALQGSAGEDFSSLAFILLRGGDKILTNPCISLAARREELRMMSALHVRTPKLVGHLTNTPHELAVAAPAGSFAVGERAYVDVSQCLCHTSLVRP